MHDTADVNMWKWICKSFCLYMQELFATCSPQLTVLTGYSTNCPDDPSMRNKWVPVKLHKPTEDKTSINQLERSVLHIHILGKDKHSPSCQELDKRDDRCHSHVCRLRMKLQPRDGYLSTSSSQTPPLRSSINSIWAIKKKKNTKNDHLWFYIWVTCCTVSWKGSCNFLVVFWFSGNLTDFFCTSTEL